MIEVLGPNMARTLVGDSYDPDFRYELETEESGFRLIVTNKKDGTTTIRELGDTETAVEDRKPIWDERKYETSRFHSIGSVLMLFLAFLILGAVAALAFMM